MNEYLLGLGEFEFAEFSTQSAISGLGQFSPTITRMLWLYFMLATLLTQIILMNTLIAILGDTHSRIMEKRDLYSITQRTKLYADYIQNITLHEVVDMKYFYVALPTEEDEENAQWEGAVSSIKQRMRKNIEFQSREVKDQTNEIKKEFLKKQAENEERIDHLRSEVQTVIHEQAALKEELTNELKSG